jgi:hypothetical protein
MNKYITKETPVIEAVRYQGVDSLPAVKKLFESRVVSGGSIVRNNNDTLTVHLPSGREFRLDKGEYLCWEHEDFYCHCEEYMEKELREITEVMTIKWMDFRHL